MRGEEDVKPSSDTGFYQALAELEHTITNRCCKQADVARAYACVLFLMPGPLPGPETTPDIARINRMIVERWSLAGLRYVKKMAWDLRAVDDSLDSPPAKR